MTEISCHLQRGSDGVGQYKRNNTIASEVGAIRKSVHRLPNCLVAGTYEVQYLEEDRQE